MSCPLHHRGPLTVFTARPTSLGRSGFVAVLTVAVVRPITTTRPRQRSRLPGPCFLSCLLISGCLQRNSFKTTTWRQNRRARRCDEGKRIPPAPSETGAASLIQIIPRCFSSHECPVDHADVAFRHSFSSVSIVLKGQTGGHMLTVWSDPLMSQHQRRQDLKKFF